MTAADPCRHRVSAVLVVRAGALLLDEVLDALAAQRRAPDRVLAVLVGGGERAVAALGARLGHEAVRTVPADTPLASALATAVRAARPGGPGDWLWLLGDDTAPEPGALAELLAAADAHPRAGLVAPKVVARDDPGVLLEVGLTTDLGGSRITGLEPGEVDQGQHDGCRPVLGAGLGGLLVAGEVWVRLAGLDPALTPYRHDVDLGWRAALAGRPAVVAPAARVRRPGGGPWPGPAPGARYPERVASLRLLLVNLPLTSLPALVLRLLPAALLRAVLLLLTGHPARAAQDLAAAGHVLGRPLSVVAARRERRRTRVVAARGPRALLAPRGTVLRRRCGAALDRLAPPDRSGSRSLGTGLLVALVLAAVGLLAARRLLGPGSLLGGGLLPAPDSVSALWSSYRAGFHPVGLGSTAPAAPDLPVLAALSAVLGGRPGAAVDVLLLGAVPLAGLSAYVCAGRLTRSRALRAWAAAAYALLPGLTGAVGSGRLGVAVAAVVLPWLAVAAAAVLRSGRPAAAAAAGLALALGTAFEPPLYPLVGGLLAAGGLAVAVAVAARAGGARAGRRVVAAVVAAALPVPLLAPWSLWAAGHPGVLLHPLDLVPATPTGRPAAWQLALLHPGGAGSPPIWLAAPVLAVALVGLVRDRRAVARSGWLVAGAAVAMGAALAATRPLDPEGVARAGWAGLPTLVAGAGLLAAGLAGADGARRATTGRGAAWRRVLAGALALGAAAVPLVAAGTWVLGGAAGPVGRGTAGGPPAFLAVAAGASSRSRTLALRMEPDGRVGFAVLRATGPRLGDPLLTGSPAERVALAALVRSALAGRAADTAGALAAADVAAVSAPAALAARLAPVLDATAGLQRLASNGAVAVWRVLLPVGRLVLRTPGRPVRVLPSGPVAAAAGIGPGPPGRRLVLAEPAVPGWRATLDGRPLARTGSGPGWVAFAVPAAGGRLRLGYDSGTRADWLRLQLVCAVLLGLTVLAGLATAGGRPAPRRQVDPAPPGPRAPAVELVGSSR